MKCTHCMATVYQNKMPLLILHKVWNVLALVVIWKIKTLQSLNKSSKSELTDSVVKILSLLVYLWYRNHFQLCWNKIQGYTIFTQILTLCFWSVFLFATMQAFVKSSPNQISMFLMLRYRYVMTWESSKYHFLLWKAEKNVKNRNKCLYRKNYIFKAFHFIKQTTVGSESLRPSNIYCHILIIF